MQDAKDAKTRLESQVSDWQKELTLLQDSLKKYKDDYEKEKLLKKTGRYPHEFIGNEFY